VSFVIVAGPPPALVPWHCVARAHSHVPTAHLSTCPTPFLLVLLLLLPAGFVMSLSFWCLLYFLALRVTRSRLAGVFAILLTIGAGA